MPGMPKQTPLPFPDAAAAGPHATDGAGARAPTDPIEPSVADADPASSSDTPSAMPEPTPPVDPGLDPNDPSAPGVEPGATSLPGTAAPPADAGPTEPAPVEPAAAEPSRIAPSQAAPSALEAPANPATTTREPGAAESRQAAPAASQTRTDLEALPVRIDRMADASFITQHSARATMHP